MVTGTQRDFMIGRSQVFRYSLVLENPKSSGMAQYQNVCLCIQSHLLKKKILPKFGSILFVPS